MTSPSDEGVRTDPELVAEGWTRRFLADEARAAEACEAYGAAGFEVRLQRLTPADFGERCQACAATACGAYVVVYTRSGEPR